MKKVRTAWGNGGDEFDESLNQCIKDGYIPIWKTYRVTSLNTSFEEAVDISMLTTKKV